MEPERFTGKWWLPDKPDHRVGGILEIDGDGQSYVELTDELIKRDRPPIVHGAAGGKSITLLDCMRVNGSSTSFGQEHTVIEKVRAMQVLVGVRLASTDQRIFSALDVEISHLTMWAGISGIEHEIVLEENGSGYDNIKLVPIESVRWRSEVRKQTVALGWHSQTGEKLSAWSRVDAATESVHLTIEPDEPIAWKNFNETVQSMRDLLTMAVQSPCLVGKRTLSIPADDGYPTRVSLYFEDGGSAKVSKRTYLDMIFSLADVDFGVIMNKWTELRDTIGLPIDVLFGLDYNPGSYYENEIFNAASAAEGIHARLHPQLTGLDPAVHDSIKDLAKEAFTNPEQYAWVKERISSNRPGLKQRYMDLAMIPDYNAMKALLSDEEVWARWLKIARNAVGHLNTNELQVKIPEEARFRLTYITKALLHLVLLNELGISAEHQREAVRKFFRYSATQFGREVGAIVLKERKTSSGGQ